MLLQRAWRYGSPHALLHWTQGAWGITWDQGDGHEWWRALVDWVRVVNHMEIVKEWCHMATEYPTGDIARHCVVVPILEPQFPRMRWAHRKWCTENVEASKCTCHHGRRLG